MKITESITANVSLKDVEQLIQENALKEGYDVVNITPEYQNEYSRDPRESGTITSRNVIGFKVELKRKATTTFGGTNIYNER